jgi:hypothetical protein
MEGVESFENGGGGGGSSSSRVMFSATAPARPQLLSPIVPLSSAASDAVAKGLVAAVDINVELRN